MNLLLNWHGLLLAALCLGYSAHAADVAPGGTVLPGDAVLQGAGASFPAPLFQRWAADYKQQTGVDVRFEAVGSGGGIARMAARLVDFGATDAPLTEAALREHGLQQFPVVIGGVVPVFNITGIASDALRLTGEVLADIYLGRITRWNDPRLQAINPELNLPAANITVVQRSDASGTSYLWTQFLGSTSEAWRKQLGPATLTPAWPVGTGGVGNAGVASYVQRTRMSLGYVEYTYAAQRHLKTARLRNPAGVDVAPSTAAFAAAAASVNWADGKQSLRSLVNAAGASSWPIAGASFVLLPQADRATDKGRAVLRFFHWALSSGQPQAAALDYVPLPPGSAGAFATP